MDISRGVHRVNRVNETPASCYPGGRRYGAPNHEKDEVWEKPCSNKSQLQRNANALPAGRGGIQISLLAFCCAAVEFGTVRSGNDGYKSDMKENQHNPESDAARILELLRRRPDDFVSSTAISRDADDGDHSLEDRNWPEPALSRLLALNLIETDGSRNYRLKIVRSANRKAPAQKFISPEIKIMLRRAGHKNSPED
jgi:hypothetical protein